MGQSKQKRGTCIFCGKNYAKGGLTRHLGSCAQRVARMEEATGKTETLYHLQVQDKWNKDYWLHLEARGSALLHTLDNYLRAIWLDCCGHLSAFWYNRVWSDPEISMRQSIDRVFAISNQVAYVYDFGSSSELNLKAVSKRTGKPLSKHPIFLMARNEAPADVCAECGEPSSYYCMECLAEEDEWVTLCDAHAETHPHNSYGDPVPLVNSPRMGMCGYDGPADPPY